MHETDSSFHNKIRSIYSYAIRSSGGHAHLGEQLSHAEWVQGFRSLVLEHRPKNHNSWLNSPSTINPLNLLINDYLPLECER